MSGVNPRAGARSGIGPGGGLSARPTAGSAAGLLVNQKCPMVNPDPS